MNAIDKANLIIYKANKVLFYALLIMILLTGFSIKINSFSYEFKGLIAIMFKIVTGKDL